MRQSINTSLLLLALLLFTVSAWSQSGRAILFGKVTNPNSSTLKVKYKENLITETEIELQGILDEKSEFAFIVELKGPRLANFVYNGKEMFLFLSPGDRFEFNFDTNDFYGSMTFQGIGGTNNKLLHRYYQKFGVRNRFTEAMMAPGLGIPNHVFDSMTVFSPMEFSDFADERQRAEYDFLKNDPATTIVTPELKQFLHSQIHYTWPSYRLAYLDIFERRDTFKTIIPDEYFIFLLDVTLSNDEAIVQPEYGNFLDQYFKYSIKEMHKDSVKDSFQKFAYQFELTKKQLNNNAEEYMLGRLLNRTIRKYNIPFIKPYFQEFKDLSITDDFLVDVTDTYERAKAFSDQQAAPNFTLEDEAGNKVSLSDYAGKMVYMSFWAGWCKPCVKEMRASTENRTLLADQDITFLYINVDKNREKWIRSMRKNPTSGVHIWSKGRRGKVANDYNVVSLPHYFLLDRKGRFISEFRKASDPEFLNQVNEFLKADKPLETPSNTSESSGE